MTGKSTITDEFTVVDFGAHFYPPELNPSRGSESIERTGVDRVTDLDTQLGEMDEAGVDAMVHSMPYFLGHEDADRTANANDALWDYVSGYDEFYGLASLPTADSGDAAATEFERCLDAGFHGGALDETAVGLTDDAMEPVLEIADRTSAPIFVHVPSMPNVEFRFNAVFGREKAMAQSICSAINRELYDSYPNLNVVWHHFGGNIASMMGRVHLHADAGRWPNQETMKPYDEFKADLEERVYIDTAGYFGYSAPLRIALEELPSTQVLFGTDYPWEPRNGTELGEFVRAVTESVTTGDAERILGGNALDLLVNV
ncbi:MAG: amidohydrolase family protein [Halobacteriota archaeon]